jgi:hypothetical protein
MQKDLSRDDMIEIFETFMKSIGYHFDENEHLTIDIDS